MKAFIALFALIAVARAGLIGHLATGSSTQTRTQDAAGNYAFAYNEQHATGGSSRAESGNALGQKIGSYSLNVGDGRQRVVKYIADGLGFRAAIATNEPGTAPKAPAAVSISAPAAVVAAPAIAAPAIAAPAFAAPAFAAPALAPAVAAPAFAPALAAPAYAAPAYAAPAYAAPALLAAPAPLTASYSSSVAHIAPAKFAAPVLAAPALAAPALAAPALAAPAPLW